MMVIDNKFELGGEIYLKTDVDQRKRIIIGIEVNGRGLIYRVACGTCESMHYEIELSEEVNVLLKTSE